MYESEQTLDFFRARALAGFNLLKWVVLSSVVLVGIVVGRATVKSRPLAVATLLR